MRYSHGSEQIGKELIRMFYAAKNFSSFSRNMFQHKVSEFIQKTIAFLSSNKKKIDPDTKSYKIEQTNDSIYIKTFEDYIKKPISQLNICQKVVHNGIKYRSTELNDQRCDASFFTNKNQHGLTFCG